MITRILNGLDRIARAIRRLSDSMLYVGIALVCVITACSLYGVVQRLLGAPVSWTLELTELLQVALAFLPAAYVQNADKHVSMELVRSLVGDHGRRVARGIVSVVGLIVTILLAYSTLSVAISSVAMDEATVVVALPIYPFKICVTLGYALLALQFAGHVWECARNLPACASGASAEGSYL